MSRLKYPKKPRPLRIREYRPKGPSPDLFHDTRFDLLYKLQYMWQREIWRQTN